MSQHVFSHNQYSVLCGWDRPLQGYFLVILVEDNLQPVFNNLDAEIPNPKTFDSFLTVLNDFKIPLPVGLMDALLLDAANNIGNSIRQWEYEPPAQITKAEQAVLQSQNTSVWLRNQLEASRGRDQCEAFMDAMILVMVLKERIRSESHNEVQENTESLQPCFSSK